MDIFDLGIEEFEKAVDKFLDSMTEEDFFEELKENGLISLHYVEK